MASPGYQGGIAAVRTGVGGLAANLNPSIIKLKNVIVAEGATFRYDLWRKEPGSALFGTNGTATGADKVIVALTDWFPTETVERIVHLAGDGHLYFTVQNPGETGDPAAFQSATTSGAGTRFGYFVTGGSENSLQNRKLFLFRNNKLPTFVDDDTTNDIPFTAAATEVGLYAVDWSDSTPPIVGIVNGGGQFNPLAPNTSTGGRLFAAGNSNNPHALYASKLGNQVNFNTTAGLISDSQVLSIFPGVGERIYGLANYQGFIVVFKYPRGVFVQDARDGDPANWLTQYITDRVGIAQSPYAALQLENDVLFLGSDGQYYLLSAVIAAAAGQQNMEIANLGMDLEIYQFLQRAYSINNLHNVQSVYQPFWQTAQFTVAGPASTQNNSRLVYDFTAVGRKGGEPRFSYSYRDKAASLALRRDPADFIQKPMYGDYLGNIVLMERDVATSFNGTSNGNGYPFRVQTPHTNFGEFENLEYDHFVQFSNRNKLMDNMEIEFLPLTPATVKVEVFVDGNLKQTFNAGLTFGGAALDHFILDVDRLGTGEVRSAGPFRLNVGAGRRVSFFFENLVAGEDVAITHLYFGFRPGDTTVSPRR